MERVRVTISSLIVFVKSYRYFLLSIVVLIFLPHFIFSYSSYSGSVLDIAGLFYTLRFVDGIIETLAFAANPILLLLNTMIIIGSCLYFTYYRKRAEQTGTEYSLIIAGVYFTLVIVTLVIVDWTGMMSIMFFEYSSLSKFGLLLAYLTIVIPVFQKLSNKKMIQTISATTNKYLKQIYSNIGTVFGFVILLAPLTMLFSSMAIDVDSSSILVTWSGATYILNWSSYLSDFYFSFYLGSQPLLFYFIFEWAPQIVLAIQMLRYLSGQTSKRLLIAGFLISLLPWVIYSPVIIMSIFFLGGLGSILVPIPILQILSILILRIERTDEVREGLEIVKPADEMVKVPIRHILLSRIRKRRNSDW
ncbi:MAG: hypothetical protein ACTSQZ_06415 [Candidatus Thorarchaeota archaeon]